MNFLDISSMVKQRVAAVLLFLIAIVGIRIFWYKASSETHHHLQIWSVLLPVVAVISFAAVVFPLPYTERIMQAENANNRDAIQRRTIRWWKVVLFALFVAGLHYLYWYELRYIYLWRGVR